MRTMGRGEFLGLPGLGAIAATAGSALADTASEGEYTERVRPSAGFGLGKGQAASLSVAWLPGQAGAELPPLKVRLVIFDLGGKPLADQEVELAPFTGASIEFALPTGVRRRQVFGYVFAGERLAEVFGGFEVFDVASGRTKISMATIGD